MIPLDNKEPYEKNMLLALVISMAIFLCYSIYLQKTSPKKTSEPEKQTAVATQVNAASESKEVLTAPEGPFFENAEKPTVVRFENSNYEVEFSTLGATIVRLLYKGEANQGHLTSTVFYEGNPSEPGLFGVRFQQSEADLSKTIFKLNRREGDGGEIFEFSYEKPGEHIIIKQFSFDPAKPVIYLSTTIRNLAGIERHFPLELTLAMEHPASHDPRQIHNYQAVASADNIESAAYDKVSKKGFTVSKPVEWAGVIKQYFGILAKPDAKTIAYSATGDPHAIHGKLALEPISLKSGANAEVNFLIYSGPLRYETLKSFRAGFENILSRGFFGIFRIWLLMSLKFFNQYTHNYGWAIIVLTLVLKGILAPITHKGYEASKKMQKLAPKVNSLKERFKADPMKFQQEVTALYRRNRVNPLGGCLPLFIQFPIFIAFYQVLNEAIELKGAPFIWWMKDLSEPDRLITFGFVIPILGWASFNLLPLLMAISQYVQQKLMPQAPGTTPEQAQVFQFMPLMFGFICYNMPSGLCLYWFMQNLFSIIHQVFINRIVVVLHHEDND